MIKVRFVKDGLEDEKGYRVIIDIAELTRKCLENASYSHRVIETIKYVLQTFGYELEEGHFKYRKSCLFNNLEAMIVHSEAYQNSKNPPKIVKHKRTCYDAYKKKLMTEIYARIALYNRKRPNHF